MAGYKAALKKHKLPFHKSRVFFQELTRENALQSCEKIFAAPPYPDGIFAANDTTAIAIMEYCRKIRLKVPEDLKIVGYSNDPRTEIITPPITSVNQFPEMMGESVVAALMTLIQSPAPAAGSYAEEIIPIQLIVRASSVGKTTKGSKQ